MWYVSDVVIDQHRPVEAVQAQLARPRKQHGAYP
jgi:hypothetical protein